MALIKFVETSNITNVTDFVAGRYIICDDGNCYYDPTTGTTVADRIKLTPDTNIKTITAENPDKTDLLEIFKENSNNVEPKDGDMLIVKTKIGETDKVSYTAYHYEADLKETDSKGFVAMDGNYSAQNVFINSPMTVTTAVGNYAKNTALNAGKSVEEILSGLFQKELFPGKDAQVTQPSISLSVNGGEGETGSTFALPTATLSVTVGSYPYNPTASGVTYDINKITLAQGSDSSTSAIASAANKISNTNKVASNTSLTLKATGTETTYSDNAISFSFVGEGTYSDGVIPKTNLGNDYESAKIIGKRIVPSMKTATFSGYRRAFIGTLTDASTSLTSEIIRDLKYNGVTQANPSTISSSNNSGVKIAKHTTNGNTSTGAVNIYFQVPVGAAKIVIAVPKGIKVSDMQYFTMSWESTADIIQESGKVVQVADASGTNGLIDYDIWSFTPAEKFSAPTAYKVKLG